MTKITIITTEGAINVPAQEILPGLFLHKKLLGNGDLTRQLRYSLTISNGLALYKDIRAGKGTIVSWAKENLTEFNWKNADSLCAKDKERLIEIKKVAPFPVSNF